MNNYNTKSTILGTELNKRIYGLDILRAYAVILVLYVHTFELLPKSLNNIIKYFICDGVTVFFTLSGFLIGNILIKTFEKQTVNIKMLVNFWGNRWMRTLPLYYIVLILSAILYKNHLDFSEIIKYIFFVQNFKDYQPEFFIVSWSLSVEEWFYFLTPITLFILCKILRFNTKISFSITIILFIVIINSFRMYRYYHLVYDIGLDPNWKLFTGWFFRTQVITRLDSVMYGVLGAYCYSYFFSSWQNHKRTKLVIGLILIFMLPYVLKYVLNDEIKLIYNNVFSFTVQGIGIMFLLPIFQSLKKGTGFIYKFITTISLISYSIYLIHSLIMYSLIKPIGEYLNLNNSIMFLLIWIITVLISCITYKYIEKPGMNLRKFILKKE